MNAVPDTATGNAERDRLYWRRRYQSMHKRAKLAEAERDAALAAVERVTAERDSAMARIAKAWELHEPFTWSFGYGPVQTCKWCADHGVSQEVASWPCPTVAALDGAPEPEWEYRYAEIHDDSEMYTYGPRDNADGCFDTAEDARDERIEDTDVVVRRPKRPASEWEVCE